MRVGRTSTPPMGTPNGIAELQPVELNGYPQWLLIRGQDVFQTAAALPARRSWRIEHVAAHYTMKELEQHFVCVNWDQRGTGRSFRPGPPPETMTIDQFVKDTIALIELLCARFGQQKILLLGHSWGSMLAMKVAAARPDLLYAVIGMGQVVDMQTRRRPLLPVCAGVCVRRAQPQGHPHLEQLGGSDTYQERRSVCPAQVARALRGDDACARYESSCLHPAECTRMFHWGLHPWSHDEGHEVFMPTVGGRSHGREFATRNTRAFRSRCFLRRKL